MARTATTADVFNAIAEATRRDILDLLARGERAVNDIVAFLGIGQPQVSKHLRVLREVNLVQVREAGRQRLYSVNGAELQQVHDWVRTYERFWDHQLASIKQHAEARAAAEKSQPPTPTRSMPS